METKVCSKCGVEKPMREYGSCKKVKSGKKSQCYECIRKTAKEWEEKNREKIRESKRDRRQFHSKKSKERVKELNYARQKNLTDSYLANILKLPVKDCSADILELKRAQLILLRTINKLKQEIQNV